MVSIKNAHRQNLESKLLAAWNPALHSYTDAVQEEKKKKAQDLFYVLEKYTATPICVGELKWVAFTGFGHRLLRDAFYLIIRHFLKPRLFHSAMTDNFRWEGLMCVRMRREDDMAMICDHFAASISLVDMDSMMSAPMMACLSRIECGSNFMGNYFTKKCAFFRAQYANAKQERRMEEQREEERQVRTLTGIEFTPRNMISLYQEYNNTIQYWRQQNTQNLRESRDHLDFVYQELGLQTERLRVLVRDIVEQQPIVQPLIDSPSTVWGTWSPSHLNSVSQSRLTSIINGFEAIQTSRSRFFSTDEQWSRAVPIA